VGVWHFARKCRRKDVKGSERIERGGANSRELEKGGKVGRGAGFDLTLTTMVALLRPARRKGKAIQSQTKLFANAMTQKRKHRYLLTSVRTVATLEQKIRRQYNIGEGRQKLGKNGSKLQVAVRPREQKGGEKRFNRVRASLTGSTNRIELKALAKLLSKKRETTGVSRTMHIKQDQRGGNRQRENALANTTQTFMSW